MKQEEQRVWYKTNLAKIVAIANDKAIEVATAAKNNNEVSANDLIVHKYL
jgi:hypothetical protein